MNCKPVLLSSCSNITGPENIVKITSNDHKLMIIKRPRLMGLCVRCIKSCAENNTGFNALPKITTYCSKCPGGEWMCEKCFDEFHK